MNCKLGLQRPRKLGRYFECGQYFPVKPSSTGYYCIIITPPMAFDDNI